MRTRNLKFKVQNITPYQTIAERFEEDKRGPVYKSVMISKTKYCFLNVPKTLASFFAPIALFKTSKWLSDTVFRFTLKDPRLYEAGENTNESRPYHLSIARNESLQIRVKLFGNYILKIIHGLVTKRNLNVCCILTEWWNVSGLWATA